MIAVVGRPELGERGAPAGLASAICVAAAQAGAAVEIVGTVADNADGDDAVVQLGRVGVRHAALLRTPEQARPLEAADVELALRYLADCRVVVLADTLDEAATRAALEGAAYHRAQLVVVSDASGAMPDAPADATVLVRPDEDAGAFARLVGRYTALLDRGTAPAEAWQAALGDTGWEPAPV